MEKKELAIDHEKVRSLLDRGHKPSFYELSFELPLLLVFLRHLGCTFSHRALLDLKLAHSKISLEGTEIVLVHMAPEEEAEEVFDLYDLQGSFRYRDPDKKLYQAFGLKCGKLQSIFSPSIWLNNLSRKALSNDELNIILGDPMQMPGVFLYYQGKIERSFIHNSINERPEYIELAKLLSMPEMNGLEDIKDILENIENLESLPSLSLTHERNNDPK